MPSANQRIGEYLLDRLIARGAFGEVWLARHHVWVDQFAAIKIPTDPQYIRNLQEEGSAIHSLAHPGIVRALNFDPYADPPYLVMEYIPGTSLRPLIESRNLSITDAVAVLRQILSALQHAHAHGILHRDLKPENILIHEDAAKIGLSAPGMVKLTDFGLGKAAVSAQSIEMSIAADASAAAELVGTQSYMAPELFAGREGDARADLYSCGVILFEMLTGEKPAGTDLPSALNPRTPKAVDELFRRSYARLDKRFSSAADFLAALDAHLGSHAPPPLPRHGPHHAPPQVPPNRGSARVPAPGPASAGQFAAPPGHPMGYSPPFRAYSAPPRAPSSSGRAVMSLVCSLLSLPMFCMGPLFGPIAVCLGFSAIAKMNRTGNKDGRALAITGMVIGLIGTVFGTMVTFAMIMR